MVRVFTHGAMGHPINPLWWTHSAILCSSQCSTTGVTKAVVCYPVCGMAFYLLLYGVRHIASDIGLFFPISCRVLLYAPSHRENSTYHSLCYISRGALVGTQNSSMNRPSKINPYQSAIKVRGFFSHKKYFHCRLIIIKISFIQYLLNYTYIFNKIKYIIFFYTNIKLLIISETTFYTSLTDY